MTAVLLAMLLSSCQSTSDDRSSGEAADRRAVDQMKRDLDEESDWIIAMVQKRVGHRFPINGGRFESCTMEMGGGLRYSVKAASNAPLPRATVDAVRWIARQLEGRGWKLKPNTPDSVIEGTKGTYYFSLRGINQYVDLTLTETECVETSAELAKEYYDR